VIPDTANVKSVSSFKAKPPAKAAQTPQAPGGRDEDATLEFASETRRTDGGEFFPLAVKVRRPVLLVAAAVLAVLLIAGGVLGALTLRTPIVSTGSLNVESDPPGAEVKVDDTVRGTTPLALSLPAGMHRLVVQRGANVKQLDVEVTSNKEKAYHIAWGASSTPPSPVLTGNLSVVSDPAGSTVVVDGSSRGQTPLTIRDLSVGRHDVVVRGSSGSYQRTVQVESGATASLVVGGAPSAAATWGWITLDSPFAVQVIEDGRVVGTSEISRIMLSPGNHELDFVSEQFGFRQSSTVNVSGGRGASVSLTIPRVTMNINALPWAEVFIDGTRIGDTPLANVQQPLGDHEIVFRHPQFGEKRQTTRLTMRDSPRISVDMRTR
jgi:hypothetical protein